MTDISGYLKRVEDHLRRGNATEHTYRPALVDLIEAIEQGIRATNEPCHQACGAPDLIVERDQVLLGYIETKDVGVSLDETERSEQLVRYRDALPNLILTDYLEFRWYVDGQHRLTVRVAQAAPDGRVRAVDGGAGALAELLQHFLKQEAPLIGTPADLARRMAGVARLIRHIITAALDVEEGDQGLLHQQMAAFREVLLHDLIPAQFADMYAQTICYGLFAARANAAAGEAFTRQTAAYSVPQTNPFLRQVFADIAGPNMDPALVWAVDDLVALLKRADLGAILADFGRHTRREDPVLHFLRDVPGRL